MIGPKRASFTGTSLSKIFLVIVICGWANLATSVSAKSASGSTAFEKRVKPLLGQYCYSCHGDTKQKADLNLQSYGSSDGVRSDRQLWTELLRKVRQGEMPPEGKPQFSEKERELVVTWLENELFPVDCDHPDPGRVTIRRLNRTEYNHTVRDLVGVTFNPADDFPSDDSGYGFDNIGDVLSLSPLLLEKYLSASADILDKAIVTPESLRQSTAKLPAAGGKGRDEHRTDGTPSPMPETHRRIFVCAPTPSTTNQCAREILSRFATRAFRRPVDASELRPLEALAEAVRRDGGSFEQSIKVALQAVLISPHFLFRGEIQARPDDPQAIHPVDEYSLASRLSYFLWSSMPDDELFRLAGEGRLRRNLETQVARMLRDPRSQAMVKNFAGQWLQTRMLKDVQPDPGTFPEFDDELGKAMVVETELFFRHVIDYDRSVLEFLTADYTFVNERLARHYQMSGVTGPEFRRVSLKGTGRGGVLTHASVLALTSNPTRTSPVKRGKWVLENLLAQAPPPPPPDVPPLNEAKEASAGLSLRARMEQHRADPMCSSCHALMDPIGFGLENFDAIGAWRDKDGTLPIDASGRLNQGETFSGAAELRAILANQRRQQFLRCLSERMLTYALGRGLEYYDRCALDRIVASLSRHEYRFSALVLGVVKSAPFQLRRGEDASSLP